MNSLSVSSYCVREQLGPVSFTFTDQENTERHLQWDFPKLLSLSEFPQRAVDQFGASAVEIVSFHFKGIDDPEIDNLGKALLDAKVTLLNVAVDVGNVGEADDVKRAADIHELKRWITRFAKIGSRFVRVNAGSPFDQEHDGEPAAHLVEALIELGRHAKQHGARLLVENHGGQSSDPAWMNRLLDAVGSEHLGLLLDLGNFDALMGPLMATLFAPPGTAPSNPFEGLDLSSLYEGIDALAGRAELVHVKVHHVGEDGTIGVIDLPRALGILAHHGYSGPLTVEYEGSGGDPWVKTQHVLTTITARAFGNTTAA